MAILKLKSPSDLLEKLRHDVQLLEDEVTSYKFLNLAITGYHIIDWIKNDETVSHYIKSEVKKMYSNEYLSVCRDLANSCKHFKLDYKDGKVSSVDSTQGAYGTGRFGKGMYGIGEEEIVIKCNDGKEYNALNFARSVLKAWDSFFQEHNL